MATSIGDAADFIVLSDSPFELHQGGNVQQALNFLLPANTDLSGSLPQGGLLSWNVRLQPVSSPLSYQVFVNGELEASQQLTGTDWHTVQTGFSFTLLQPSPTPNKIEFRITEGAARLQIGDVIVWYRKEIHDIHGA